jgi:hypothetical protein
VAHKSEYGSIRQQIQQREDGRPLFGNLPPPQARIIDVNSMDAEMHRAAVANAALGIKRAYDAYGVCTAVRPLFMTSQENAERRRTGDMRLLRLRYEAMTVSQVVANAVFALREAEHQAEEALRNHHKLLLLKAGNDATSDNNVSTAKAKNESEKSSLGLCVSLSLPLPSLLRDRRVKERIIPSGSSRAGTASPTDILGVVSLHQRIDLPVACGSPVGPPAESVLREAIDKIVQDEDDLKRQLQLFVDWETTRSDRYPGCYLPRAEPGAAEQYEVVVSPLLFDDYWKRTQQQQPAPPSSSFGGSVVEDDAEYAKLDFFRDEHSPPYVLHCPPYAVPHRLVVCSAPAKALLPLSAASAPSGQCREQASLTSVLDTADVIIPVPATLVSKLLGVMALRGKFIGEALPIEQ